jgi:hypothetical protein
MRTVEDYEAIRRAYFLDGTSVREIARQWHHSRRLIRKAIAHIIAPKMSTPGEYLSLLQNPEEARQNPYYALRFTLQEVAWRCLFNPTQPREYNLALFMACLGALKFNNLDAPAKHLLFLTAAHIGQTL